MDTQKIIRTAAIAVCLLGITAAIHFAGDSPSVWRKFLQYLFFLPGVVAAFWFGWRGGLLTAILATLCYAPSLTTLTVDQAGESLDLLLIGFLLGFLADREHRKTRLLEETAAELSAAYAKLESNVERWKQAERLSAIGQLSAGLAHEIRTPLAAIEGAAELLRSDRADSALRDEMTAILQKESKRLNRLLAELLDFSRPRRPEFRAVDLAPMADSIVRLLQVQAARKSITLRSSIPAGLTPVECDPEQLRQVLLNLCLNAVQAADKPGEIALHAATNGATAHLEVRDQGPGIPEDVRTRIFEPFFTTKHDGTGLGLAVARQIIDNHGGTISAEPNRPRGVRFLIDIPLLQEKRQP